MKALLVKEDMVRLHVALQQLAAHASGIVSHLVMKHAGIGRGQLDRCSGRHVGRRSPLAADDDATSELERVDGRVLVDDSILENSKHSVEDRVCMCAGCVVTGGRTRL